MFHYYLCFVCFTPFSLWGDLFWHLENFVQAVCDWKISHVVETDFSLAASRKCVWNGLPWSVCLPCLSSSCPLDTPKLQPLYPKSLWFVVIFRIIGALMARNGEICVRGWWCHCCSLSTALLISGFQGLSAASTMPIMNMLFPRMDTHGNIGDGV